MFARVDDSGPVPTTVSCDIKSKSESAVCSQSYKATGGAAAGTITASAQVAQNSANSTVSGGSFNFGSDQIHYNALVITKGAEKLNGNGTIASKTPTAPTSEYLPTTPKILECVLIVYRLCRCSDGYEDEWCRCLNCARCVVGWCRCHRCLCLLIPSRISIQH
jgi:hypothetical protein